MIGEDMEQKISKLKSEIKALDMGFAQKSLIKKGRKKNNYVMQIEGAKKPFNMQIEGAKIFLVIQIEGVIFKIKTKFQTLNVFDAYLVSHPN